MEDLYKLAEEWWLENGKTDSQEIIISLELLLQNVALQVKLEMLESLMYAEELLKRRRGE